METPMERRYPPVQIRLYRSVYTPRLRFSAGNRVKLKKEEKREEKKNRAYFIGPSVFLPSDIILRRGYTRHAVKRHLFSFPTLGEVGNRIKFARSNVERKEK